MRTACNGETIHKAPELLLIVRLVHAITNCGERADNDFTQQTPSRTKCEIAEIPADQRDVLHWIGKAVTRLHLVQNGRRKNAGLVYRDDVLAAAEPLGQQIAQYSGRRFRTALAIVIIVRTGDRSQFPGRKVVIDATQSEVVICRDLCNCSKQDCSIGSAARL